MKIALLASLLSSAAAFAPSQKVRIIRIQNNRVLFAKKKQRRGEQSVCVSSPFSVSSSLLSTKNYHVQYYIIYIRWYSHPSLIYCVLYSECCLDHITWRGNVQVSPVLAQAQEYGRLGRQRRL